MGQGVETVKVVLDTNTVVSAVLFPRGRLTWIREAWASGQCLPLVSRATAQELIHVLAYPKFNLDDDDIEIILAAYLPFASVVSDRSRVADLPICRDPDDQKFLTLASRGGAEVHVTGDRALLVLHGQTGFDIESPAGFRRRCGTRAAE